MVPRGAPLAEATVLGRLTAAAAGAEYRPMSVFISFPVESVQRSSEFYAALGWRLNAEYSSEGGACFDLDDNTSIMAVSRDVYASVGGTEELVGGPGTPSPVTVSWAMDSQEAVDELLVKAEAAGGRMGDIDDYGFMYQRQFDDPDGYHYSPFYVRPEGSEAADPA
jgi:predicted lactoylglutathione lyase